MVWQKFGGHVSEAVEAAAEYQVPWDRTRQYEEKLRRQHQNTKLFPQKSGKSKFGYILMGKKRPQLVRQSVNYIKIVQYLRASFWAGNRSQKHGTPASESKHLNVMLKKYR